MPDNRLLDIVDFPSLVEYLADELEWPIEEDTFDDLDALAFDYSPEELSLPEEVCAKVHTIKQMRPLVTNQPWAVFYIEFESKRLPVTALRRVLNRFVEKKRANVRDRATWKMQDLLFVNAHGVDEDRGITFAHFSKPEKGYTEVLREFMWTRRETHLNHVEKYVHCLQWPEGGTSQKAWREQWRSAFVGSKRKAIRSSRELAEEMAHFAREVRVRVEEVLELTRDDPEDPLQELYAAFRSLLVHDLSEGDFADTYAQTMAYGLFAARAAHPGEPFRLKDAPDRVPSTNPFLKSLFAQCFGLASVGGGRIDPEELALSRLIELFESLEPEDMQRILDEFGSQTGDPVIHFYESFLAAYDRRRKVERGVFYTPQPVVSFIVRSVHEALQRDFGLEDGLADTATWGDMKKRFPGLELPAGATNKAPFVNILDPATGTATFLVEVIDVIHNTLREKWNRQRMPEAQQRAMWNRYVPDHLLPRLHGFELMMAPYTIAHMKIGLKLRETGFTAWQALGARNRIRVYLTNALEEPVDPGDYLTETAPALAHETQQANTTKRGVPVTVVIGNPPYSGHSANDSEWAARLLRGGVEPAANYFEVDGKPLGERNPKWLNDDYVKFMRYAQWRLQSSGAGVWSFITNHGYLDNPTFRGMRQSLMQTFTGIHVVDLHGNAKKKETCPDGSPDQNVFDIQQGVAVAVFVEKPGDGAEVRHGDLHGLREKKYTRLLEVTSGRLAAEKLTPQAPFYLFCPEDRDLWAEYGAWSVLNGVLPMNSVGIVTARDALTVHWTSDDVWDVVRDFAKRPVEEARSAYNLGKDARDWKVHMAQKDVRQSGPKEMNLVPILYRPFDTRFTYYTGHSRGFICMPRPEVMRHMLGGGNVGLGTTRSIEIGRGWEHCFVSAQIVQHHTVSLKEVNYLFPVYRVLDAEDMEAQGAETGDDAARVPNLGGDYIAALAAATGLRWQGVGRGDLKATFAAEDVFYFIYAVLHSPAYRKRYREFLARDFARVPSSASADLFRELGALGERLVTLHLLEGFGEDRFGHQAEMLALLDQAAGDYPFAGDDRSVTKAGEKKKTLADVRDGAGRVTINRTSGFENVPEAVWDFHIGGYQVCHKWLADRKKAGRSLSGDDIAHYQKIIVALRETIRLMNEIDTVIDRHGGWPGAFQVSTDAPEAG